MKKIITTAVAICFVSFAFYMSSCKPKQITKTSITTPTTSVCKGNAPTFTGEIKNIIDVNCASTCHSARNSADGIDLSTYENVKMEAEKKRFIGSIKHQEGYDAMPAKHDKLDDVTIQKIECWIENGMPK